MTILTKEERNDILEIGKNGSMVKHNGYWYFLHKGKKYKRSRLRYQFFHNVKLSIYDLIHHKDMNKENDYILNLQLVNSEEHTRIHHQLYKGKHEKMEVT